MSQTAIRKSDAAAQAPALGASPARRAKLRRLTLTDFRSYERTEIELDGRPVALAGANGAGKTNILEAISLIGPGRGVRTARLDELPRLDGPGGWAVAARLDDGEDERRFGVGVTTSKPDRRVCRIDDTAAAGPGAFSEHLRFLWLTPAQDRLFLEGAGERRRFLDRMALAHDPAHGKISSAFEQAMRQRQRLLDEGGRDDEWLCALEAQMAETGVAVAAGRRHIAAMLAAANVVSGETLFPTADVALQGDLEIALENRKAADVEEDYTAQLKCRRRLDTEAGRALLGPHRSDLLVYHRGKGRLARLCSTGEQKALLIGLVLANAQALAASAGNTPLILLLDEIAAHLDEERRAGLFSILDGLGFQAFMTGTDKSLFTAWGDRAQYFEACDSALHEATLS